MATLVLACPICLQKIRAPGNVLGRQIRCPQCKNGFTAVDPAAVPSEPIPALRQAARELAPPTETAAPTVDPLGLDDDADVAFDEPAPAASSGFIDFIMFRRLMTPSILVVLFFLGVAVILLIALVFAAIAILTVRAAGFPILIGVLAVLLDLVVAASTLVIWRVSCEALAILFRTADRAQ